MISEVYDTIYSTIDDLEFWIDILKKEFPIKDPSKIKILELGSGTGRVILFLAKRGYRIDGIEISEKMIEKCKEKLKTYSDNVNERIQIHQGDMTNFNLNSKYDIIICPSNTWPMLIEKGDRIKALKIISAHLKDKGLLVLDIWQKDLSQLKPDIWNLWDYETKQTFYPQKKIFWCEYTTVHPNEMLEQIEISATHIKDSQVNSFTEKFLIKLFTKEEVEQELKTTGFEIKKIYGDYHGGRWNAESELMTFAAQKR